MEKIIVYLDDASWAWKQLDALGAAAPYARTQWILVACAPRMTRRIGKWASHQAREQWREKWAAKLFSQIAPRLLDMGHSLETVLAKEPLPELTRRLLARNGPAKVLDARRPKFGFDTPGDFEDPPPARYRGWQSPVAAIGTAALLLAAGD